MKKMPVLVIVLALLSLMGCSMPTSAVQRPLYSFTKDEKVKKSGFMGTRKIITIKDFRQNEAYDEDIEGLKEDVEEYISKRPELSETAKNNLRELKVTQDSRAEEVIFLLGKPDKVARASGAGRYGATEIWIYRIGKIRAFTVFVFPVFFVHEGYYLYFKDGVLVEIERHYLEQIVKQGSAPGIVESKTNAK